MGKIDDFEHDVPKEIEGLDDSEKLEGLDDSEELDMSDYPLDSLLIRNATRTIHEVLRRIKQNDYIMDPDFQRDFIWPLDKQSKLIESLLMRIPLPVFYLAERDDGKIIVIDGLQRLTTIHHFLENKFALRALDNANEVFKAKRFKNLPTKLQKRIEDTELILYILDEKVPARAKLDIFERVNGGTPLSRQQMRNCIYNGKATKLLSDLVKTNEFSDATGNSLSWKTMRDREFVNRFMAFHVLGLNEYKGDMDQFLADALKEISTYEPEQIEVLKKDFITSMKANYKFFGKFAFRKHKKGQTTRNVINAALFDVFSIAFVNQAINEADKNEILNKFYELQENDDFQSSITYSTNGIRQVNMRFSLIEKMLGEIL